MQLVQLGCTFGWTHPDSIDVIAGVDAHTGYPINNSENASAITLVEDEFDIGAAFGSNYRGTTTGIVVQKGPNYHRGEDPAARLFASVLTPGQAAEPAHIDISPDELSFPDNDGTTHALAKGVIEQLGSPPWDFNDKTFAMRS